MLNKILKQIKEQAKEENIYLNEDMKKHTTFKIGEPAEIFVKVETDWRNRENKLRAFGYIE